MITQARFHIRQVKIKLDRVNLKFFTHIISFNHQSQHLEVRTTTPCHKEDRTQRNDVTCPTDWAQANNSP